MCIFADACDLSAAQKVLLDLPADAYGQLYINDDGVPVSLMAPERVQVNRLRACPGRCALADALSGWAGEWLPEGWDPTGETPTVWMLPGATARLCASDHDGVTRLITVLPSDQLMHG